MSDFRDIQHGVNEEHNSRVALVSDQHVLKQIKVVPNEVSCSIDNMYHLQNILVRRGPLRVREAQIGRKKALELSHPCVRVAKFFSFGLYCSAPPHCLLPLRLSVSHSTA